MKKKFVKPALISGTLLSIGFWLGQFNAWLDKHSPSNVPDATSTPSREPLYWVAPMDSNYRRDKPGKSPMGMDLVPIFDKTSDDDGIKVSENVLMSFGVTTEKITRGRLERQINTFGFTEWNQESIRHHHPRIAGWVERLYVKTQGETINKGQPLYALYSPELVNAQADYLLALKQNNTTLIAAAESRLRAFQVQDDFIQQLKQTKKIQQNILTRAEYSGVLLTLPISEGMYVSPNEPLFSTASLDEIWVIADILESYAQQVTTRLQADISVDAYPNHTFRGDIDFINPTIIDHRLNARIRIANTQGLLKPNMLTHIRILLPPLQETLLAPTQAIIQTQDQDRVILAHGQGRFTSQPITKGLSSQGQTQILKGLKAGDEIVTNAQFLLDAETQTLTAIKRLNSEASKNQDPKTEHSMHDMDHSTHHQHMHHH
ncbi:MAG: efflux RND transporter periplasmic adaptor subunit [Cellvibrionales bacterium]|nr:efflux RND transporter periplasmic adaptor subunit [Cellvibrionales bacterium]